MAEERGATIIDPTASALKAIHDDLAAFRLDTHGRLSRIESGFDQMDKRVSNLENMQRWAFGIMVGTWVTLMLGVLGLYFKR